MKTYDVVVIGGGSAGLAAAEAARATGASVCVIEREGLGGDCPHWACVPTKTLLRSAVLYDHLRHASAFGIIARNVRFSFRAIAARRARIVQTVTGNGKRLFARMEQLGIDVVYGDARFADDTTIAVGRTKLRAKTVLVATGAEDVVPPIAGIEFVNVLGSREVTQLHSLPASVCIVGGGPVGAEFATLFSLLGSNVTLLEAGSHILPREDADIAALAAAALRGHGAQVYQNAKALSVTRSGRGVRVTYQVGDRPRTAVTVAALVVAVGRRPRVREIGLLDLGVATDAHGGVVLDDMLRTSLKHIFLAGDVAAGYQFTHVAHHQGTLAGLAAAGRAPRPSKKSLVVPRVTFVEPEVASVGMTEADARKTHAGVQVAKFPIGALSRAVIDDERDGLLKVVVGARGRILGGHMLGSRAGEVIHEIALAMHAGIPFDELASLLHAFPTYSEAIPAAFDYLQ